MFREQNENKNLEKMCAEKGDSALSSNVKYSEKSDRAF